MINKINTINFKSDSNNISFNKPRQIPMMPIDEPQDDLFIMQDMVKKAQKKEKQQEKLQKLSAYGTVGIAVGLVGSLILGIISTARGGSSAVKALEKAAEEVQKINYMDVTNEKTFEQLTLSKEMKKVVEDLKTTIERSSWLAKKGSKGGSGIMLYGEPGGGKNAYVYAMTKYMNEIFPDSKLVMMDVLKFKDKYVGGTENNIIGFVENVLKEAKNNPGKKFVVFLDEFDSIARKDLSSNASMSDSFQNAFKTTLTNLTSVPNIQVIAATNKAAKNAPLETLLDEAILNRFPTKIYVPLPDKEQLKIAFTEHYKSLPKELVDKALTDAKNSELDEICTYIAKKEHHASFRDMQYILEKARIISEGKGRKEGSPITMQDLKQAVKQHAENENWTTKINVIPPKTKSIQETVVKNVKAWIKKFKTSNKE